ncbi:MAG: thiamine diphosphokinase [Bacteroidales bacterium]|nr:thiamine diphosphokinase [Bacteroidales bacterium]
MESSGIDVVVMAAGDRPTHPVPLRALREASAVVCCDSAYLDLKTAAPHQADTAMVVGDGDSLPPAEKAALGDRWLQIGEQDYNDLHKAVHWTATNLPLRGNRLTIVGATGRREDHTLGNISYLATFADELPWLQVEMLTDHGRLTFCRGQREYPSFPRQQVSIFSLTPDVPITLDGLQWPAEGLRATRWWQATLNSALGGSFTVEGGELVVFQTYEPK